MPDRVRIVRALARALARSRSAEIDEEVADVLGLAFDGSRWMVAVQDRRRRLRLVDVSRLSRVRATRERMAPAPEGFEPREFAWQPWLGSCGAAAGGLTLWIDDRAVEVAAAALPVRRLRHAPGGGWLARVRTSDRQRLAALARSLSPWAEVHSGSMSARRAAGKTEDTAEARLLRLASWLLEQGGDPVSRRQIFEAFPASYRGRPDAIEKKFSRDKDALRRLGYAIETVELGGAEDPVGYVLSARACRLPRIALGPEEAALVWSAAIASARLSTHPLQEDLESALRKLIVGAQGLPPRAAAIEELVTEPPAGQEKLLERLVQAWERRKRLTLDYWRIAANEVVTRDVDVYGWASRRGEWIFVGWCHLRKGVRIFYLSRVHKLRVNAVRAQDPDYTIPKAFDIRRWSRQQTWDYDVHPPRPVTVRFRGSLARIARNLVPTATVSMDVEGGRVARFEVRNLAGLVRQLLAWGPEAELVEPEDGRAMARDVLGRLAERPGRTP